WHTRFSRDWSSDVCSSDLTLQAGGWPRSVDAGAGWYVISATVVILTLALPIAALLASLRQPAGPVAMLRQYGPEFGGSILIAARSEERRVGTGSRSAEERV